MTKAQSIDKSDLLQAADVFEQTILKMYALTELVPMVLSEDYGGPQDNNLRDGVGYLMADVHREMKQMSDAYWKLSSSKAVHSKLRAVGANG